MSFNTVIPHPDCQLVEAVIDGYEDWQTATDIIEDMVDLAEDHDWRRFLIDFTRVVMRVSVSEAPDLATFFDKIFPAHCGLGLYLPTDTQAALSVQAFGDTMTGLGHTVVYLKSSEERQVWMTAPFRQTGTG